MEDKFFELKKNIEKERATNKNNQEKIDSLTD